MLAVRDSRERSLSDMFETLPLHAGINAEFAARARRIKRYGDNIRVID